MRNRKKKVVKWFMVGINEIKRKEVAARKWISESD